MFFKLFEIFHRDVDIHHLYDWFAVYVYAIRVDILDEGCISNLKYDKQI